MSVVKGRYMCLYRRHIPINLPMYENIYNTVATVDSSDTEANLHCKVFSSNQSAIAITYVQ